VSSDKALVDELLVPVLGLRGGGQIVKAGVRVPQRACAFPDLFEADSEIQRLIVVAMEARLAVAVLCQVALSWGISKVGIPSVSTVLTHLSLTR
jgi:hypothetical protein